MARHQVMLMKWLLAGYSCYSNTLFDQYLLMIRGHSQDVGRAMSLLPDRSVCMFETQNHVSLRGSWLP